METARSVLNELLKTISIGKKNTVLIFEMRRSAKSSNGNEALIGWSPYVWIQPFLDKLLDILEHTPLLPLL